MGKTKENGGGGGRKGLTFVFKELVRVGQVCKQLHEEISKDVTIWKGIPKIYLREGSKREERVGWKEEKGIAKGKETKN